MKRIVLALVLVFAATTLFAGGKECNMKNMASKSVALTGTLITTGEGDHEKTLFKVANSDKSYTVCEKTKASVLKLSNDGSTLQVKGKVVSCGEGEELLIEDAKKI
jgi:hypothetical protein